MSWISDSGYDILSPPDRAYLFAMVDRAWIPVAMVKGDMLREGRPRYSLAYGNKWRAGPGSFALDPVHLPLDGKIQPQTSLFGALLDAGPDNWGGRLLDEQFVHLFEQARTAKGLQVRSRRPTALDRLLLAGDDRVGALAFGPTPAKPLLHPSVVPIRDLADVEDAMVRFDAGEAVDRDLRLLATCTSLGGARPKATVRHHDGSLWLAKFRRKSVDTVNMVRAEHAAMTMARLAGIDAAETQLVSLGDREALLVRRFDRRRDTAGKERRLPYLSAISLTGYNAADVGGSYLEIADRMRQQCVGCPAGDLAQLFRRMVFNIASGNTDDHLKNHGLLLIDGRWRLSPAFDVVPTIGGSDFQAISVGRFGTTSSWENLLSGCDRFGLSVEEARAIAGQVVAVTSRWRDHFMECGVTTSDLRIIERSQGRLVPP